MRMMEVHNSGSSPHVGRRATPEEEPRDRCSFLGYKGPTPITRAIISIVSPIKTGPHQVRIAARKMAVWVTASEGTVFIDI